MPESKPHPSVRLFAGRLQVWRGLFRRWVHVLRLPRWFPHIPLCIGLAAAGLILLISAHDLRLLSAGDLHRSVGEMMHGSPVIWRAALGVAMLTMSIGLLLRSRFSWVVSLLLTAATLLLALRFRHSTWSIAIYYDGLLLVSLLLAYRVFNRSSLAAGTVFAVVSGFMLLAYAVLGSYYLGAEFKPPIGDLVTAVYFSIVTMSTVGFGDITPQTSDARLFTVSIIILGITVFATSISAIIGPIIGGSLRRIINRKDKRMKRKDHYIIAGHSQLARNTYLELQKRHQPVTLIFARPPADNDYADADVIIGDPTSLDVLRQAGADEAHTILALRDDDSENAFTILAVKELGGKARTVAAVNDGKHINRVKSVHPDILIAPQVIGGEMLAMVLSGEAVTGETVIGRFLQFGSQP